MIRLHIIAVALGLWGASLQCHSRVWGEWDTWGQQPDGTYLNPVIPADYCDLDCIRVGDDFYAMTSTFQFSPGVTIIHSRDLVNWEIAGHAVPDITQIGPALGPDVMDRYARGIWAGTMRHHDGRFYVYFGTPDEGFFMTSAPAPEGPWKPLIQLYQGPGWDDCTVMWDDATGNAWFVGTCFADGYKTYIYEMAPDGKSVDFATGRLINEGNGREASKLIKKDGWYYLVFSEYKPEMGRYVMAKRTRSLSLPFAEEKMLALPSVDACEPNQGGIVEGPDGNWYFFTHHGIGEWSGRVASLLPVTWIDGWPIIGEVTSDGIGTMAWSGTMPAIVDGEPLHMQRSDDFDSPQLGPQWQCNYAPVAGAISTTERPGWLRIKACMPLEANNLLKAPNMLTTRTFRSHANVVTTKLDLSGMADGQKCGLAHFSKDNSGIGAVKEHGEVYLEYFHGTEAVRGPRLESPYLWLRSQWGTDGLSTYSYSTDGDNFVPFGEPYQLKWGNYRGDRLGLYCYNNQSSAGHADFDYLHYHMSHAR